MRDARILGRPGRLATRLTSTAFFQTPSEPQISAALLDRTPAQSTTRDETVTRYRPPRPGDVLAVRSSDPHLDEVTVLIHTVADTGGYLLLAGAWGGHDLEVVIRRVGDTNPLEA